MDEDFLIGHLRPDIPGFDFGDSARESGTFICGMALRRNLLGIQDFQGITYEQARMWFAYAVIKYTVSQGIFCRHPTSTELWHRDPKEFSRDQEMGLIAGLMATEDISTLSNILQELKKHPLTFQNGDLITTEWTVFDRSLTPDKRKWWVPILDVGLVINAVLRLITAFFDRDSCGQDINLTKHILLACVIKPTHMARFAKWLYTFRPMPQDSLHKNPILAAWMRYYRKNENPPIDEVWAPIILRFF